MTSINSILHKPDETTNKSLVFYPCSDSVKCVNEVEHLRVKSKLI